MSTFACKICDKSYTNISNLKRHNKKLCQVKITQYQCGYCQKYFSADCSLKYHVKNNCKKVNFAKKKINVKSKHIPQGPSQRIQLFESRKQQLRSKFVVGDNVLDYLKQNLGEKEATNFFLTNVLSKKYGKIIEQTYLEGKNSDEYPMACTNRGHFRFLNESGKLIDDIDGEILVQTLVNCIQNAILITSNKLIKKYMGKISTLYEVYDIKKIQNEACDISKPINRKKIKEFLIKRIINPSHHFFIQKESVLELHKKYVETLEKLLEIEEKKLKLNNN